MSGYELCINVKSMLGNGAPKVDTLLQAALPCLGKLALLLKCL